MRPASLLLTLSLALAGCVTPATLGEDAPATPAPATGTMPWTLTRCTYLVGWSPADPAKLQARVPDGFSIPNARPFGLAEAPLAYLGTEVFECEEGSGLDGTIGTMTYGSIWYSVEVPEDARIDDIDFTMMKEEILVPDAPRRELLAARGLSVHDGAIAWLDSTVPGSIAASLTLDTFGTFTLALDTPQETSAPTDTDEFVEYTPATDGLAHWRTSYAWDEATYMTGRGTIHWPEGTWAADAVGGPVAPGQFHQGIWSFQGTLTLPS